MNNIILIFIISISCLASQFFFLRSILTIYNGAEFIISFFFIVWFGFSAAGTAFGFFFKKKKSALFIFSNIYLSILPVSIILIRFTSQFFYDGNSVYSIIKSLFFCITAIGFPCFINGIIFSLACVKKNEKSNLINLYAAETAGFFLSGIITMFSVNYMIDMKIFFIIIIICSILIMISIRSNKIKYIFLFPVLLSSIALFYHQIIIKNISKTLFAGYTFIEEVNTPYSRIDIFSSPDDTEKFVFFSGKPVIMNYEEGADEEIVYTAAALADTNPAILCEGSIFYALLEKINNISPDNLDVIFNSEKLKNAYERAVSNKSKKILLKNPPDYIFSSLQEFSLNINKKYDILFLQPGSISMLSSLFYFSETSLINLKKLIKPNGIAVFILSGENAYISDESRKMKSEISYLIKKIFGYSEIFPLNSTFIIASQNNIQKNLNSILFTLRERNIPLFFYNEFNVGMRLHSMNSLALSKFDSIKIVNNIQPYTIFGRGIAQFISEYDSGFSKKINLIINHILNFTNIYASIIAAVFLFSLKFFSKFKYLNCLAFYSGAAGIASQMLVIYAFQIKYGTLYQYIGLLISSFTSGSFLILLLSKFYFINKPEYKIKGLFIAVLIYILSVPFLFKSDAYKFLFYLFSFTAGFISSGVFTAAVYLNDCELTVTKHINKTSSEMLYISDLAGAAFSIVFIPLFIIPLFGFIYPSILFALTALIFFRLKMI